MALTLLTPDAATFLGPGSRVDGTCTGAVDVISTLRIGTRIYCGSASRTFGAGTWGQVMGVDHINLRLFTGRLTGSFTPPWERGAAFAQPMDLVITSVTFPGPVQVDEITLSGCLWDPVSSIGRFMWELFQPTPPEHDAMLDDILASVHRTFPAT